ncbi:MAG: hypothetical protein JWM10_3205 [Myxococcaceae bacterium]|nr:hypothetical protein [Myxococcaceae bacterium]
MPSSSSDFRAWIGDHVSEDAHPAEPAWLYNALDRVESLGSPFSCKRLAGDRYGVSREGTDEQLTITDPERIEMMAYLEEEYMGGMDGESYEGYEHAISKDD